MTESLTAAILDRLADETDVARDRLAVGAGSEGEGLG